LQIVRNASVTKLIDHCFLLIKIAPNFFFFLTILVALDNRLETKEKKTCKLKKRKTLTNEKVKDTNTNNFSQTMFCGKEKTRRQIYLQKLC
jgi:hypothetical protein